jgi:hypothetical protein
LNPADAADDLLDGEMADAGGVAAERCVDDPQLVQRAGGELLDEFFVADFKQVNVADESPTRYDARQHLELKLDGRMRESAARRQYVDYQRAMFPATDRLDPPVVVGPGAALAECVRQLEMQFIRLGRQFVRFAIIGSKKQPERRTRGLSLWRDRLPIRCTHPCIQGRASVD